MEFEKMFEKVGEEIDKVIERVGEKMSKVAEKAKTKAEESRVRFSEDVMKKIHRYGEKFSPENKNLSNFERAVANIAIAFAHSLEEAYNKFSKEMFLTEKEKKSRFGVIGKAWSSRYVPRERAITSVRFAKEVEKKLSTKKLCDEMLKDIVESLSSTPSELYAYYLQGHFIGVKRSKTHDEKVKIVKEILIRY